jgi:putative endonuclease
MVYTVYALYSESIDRLYIGQTKDLTQRLTSHREYNKGFTARANDWKLIFYEDVPTRSEAIRRERQLKTGSGRRFLRDLLS